MTRSLRPIALLGSLVIALLAFVPPTPVAADGGGGGGGTERALAPAKPEDPQYTTAVKAIKANEFAKAIPLLEGVVPRDPKNPDASNCRASPPPKNRNPPAP